jgi:hypothetical protein
LTKGAAETHPDVLFADAQRIPLQKQREKKRNVKETHPTYLHVVKGSEYRW